MIEEALSYDASRHYPPYFSEFIEITLDVFREMNKENKE